LRLDKGWRAREVRTWREEETTQTTKAKAVWNSLGLLVAQRFHGDEADEVLVRILDGRLSVEYILWNGKTTPLLPTDLC
jgi:hypothetical protein